MRNSLLGGYFALKKGMGAAADEIYAKVSADTATMDLEPAEKAKADKLLLQLRDGVKSGEIGIMDAGKLVAALEDSDLMTYAGLFTAKSVINSNDELTAEEKADGVSSRNNGAVSGRPKHLGTVSQGDVPPGSALRLNKSHWPLF